MVEADQRTVEDGTPAYRLWDELFRFGLELALSTPNGTLEERREAWQRLLQAQERSLAERDRMWERLVAGLGTGSR